MFFYFLWTFPVYPNISQTVNITFEIFFHPTEDLVWHSLHYFTKSPTGAKPMCQFPNISQCKYHLATFLRTVSSWCERRAYRYMASRSTSCQRGDMAWRPHEGATKINWYHSCHRRYYTQLPLPALPSLDFKHLELGWKGTSSVKIIGFFSNHILCQVICHLASIIFSGGLTFPKHISWSYTSFSIACLM